MLKTIVRYFTIADYEDEELWLREMHRSGWKMVGLTAPCFFRFESCTPEDVIYRLDYKNGTQTPDYLKMIQDFGWELVLDSKFCGWVYFRKPASEAETPEDGELFSDDESRLELVTKLVKTRVWPLIFIFLCCIIPNLLNSMNGLYSGFAGTFFTWFFSIAFVLYAYLLLHCGLKLKKNKEKYSNRG